MVEAAEQQESGKGLAALFQEGVASISTKRNNDLFKELDKRELTSDEEAIIQQRIQHQRRMLKEYEKREESRKIRELVEVCGGRVTDEEAKYALDQFGGREDDAAAALVSHGNYLAKVKNVVSGVPMPVAAPKAPPAERKRPRPNRPSVNQFQTLTSSSTCDANVFVGSFRGKLQPVAAGGCGRNARVYEGEANAPEESSSAPSSNKPDESEPQQKSGEPTSESSSDSVTRPESDGCCLEAKALKFPVRKGRASRQRAHPSKWGTVHDKLKADEAVVQVVEALVAASEAVLSQQFPERKNGDGNQEKPVDDQRKEEGTEALPTSVCDLPAATENTPRHEHSKCTTDQDIKLYAGNVDQAKSMVANGEPGAGNGSDALATTRGFEISAGMEHVSSSLQDQSHSSAATFTWVTSEAAEKELQMQDKKGKDVQHGEELAVRPLEKEVEKSTDATLATKRGQKRARAVSKEDSKGNDVEEKLSVPTASKKNRPTGIHRAKKCPAPGKSMEHADQASEESNSCPAQSDSTSPDKEGKVGAESAQAAGALSPQPQAGPSSADSSAVQPKPQQPGSSDASEARSREPLRTLAVPVNKPRLGRVKRCSSKKVELVEAGEIRLDAGWHNSGYIFPAGFKSRTIFRSSVDPTQLCVHECEIVGEGGDFWPAPTFRVVALDRPEWPLLAKSATGCWNAVLSRINAEIRRRIEAGEDWPPPPKTAIAGPEYFGLSHPAIVEKIEQLDPERKCTGYWHGKQDREVCLSGGTPAPRPSPPPPPPRAVPAPRAPRAPRPPKPPSVRGGRGKLNARGAGRGNARGSGRGTSRRSERDPDDMEAMIASNRWSSLSRAERYRNRYGDAAAEEMEQDNPLPDMIDPITLEQVISPAISPYGHVMGHATWMAVLAEQGKCPFTQKPLRRDQITVLTKHNIERHRPTIVSL